jgi:chromosome segregation ATPase
MKEKKHAEDRLAQFSQKQQEEDEKLKSIGKQRTKVFIHTQTFNIIIFMGVFIQLESQVHDMNERLENERHLRDQLEVSKRKLEIELSEASESCDEKRLKIESLNNEIVKYERELSVLRTKYLITILLTADC